MMTIEKARILIVESDCDAGALVVRTLEAFGHRVVWIRDTGAAVEELRGAWADLVLVGAASRAAIGAAESLARYAEFSGIPVIPMSAAPDARECLSRPLCPGVDKPLGSAGLRDLVERALRGTFVPGPERQNETMTARIAPQAPSKALSSEGEASFSS